MTAITARADSTTNDIAFLRGLLYGVIAAALVAASIVAAVWLTSQPAATKGHTPEAGPASVPAQVDQNHPIIRPGGVKVY